MLADSHPRHKERIAALREYGILDTPPEQSFADIVELVASFCETPVALISFVDEDRQWFKAETGLGCDHTDLERSVCSHVILEQDIVEIEDMALDPRTSDNPLIAEEGFRFYAGAPMITVDGLPLGSLCVLDRKPRRLDDRQRRLLKVLAGRVVRELDLRLALGREEVLRREIDHRIKNSLGTIGAIINLEKRRNDNQTVKDAIAGIQMRLASLSALHGELYRDPRQHSVDARVLFENIVPHLRAILPDHVDLTSEVDDVGLGTRTASEILLIVNEFVSNSGKHAFPNNRDGKIHIMLRSLDRDHVELTCRDTGTADEDAIKQLEDAKGLGHIVIETLARSLRADYDWTLAQPGLQLVVGPIDSRVRD